MNRPIQSLCFITGLVFFTQSQIWIWTTIDEKKIIPFLLTSVIFILIAIYLKEERN